MGEQASLEFDMTFGDVLLHKQVQAYDKKSQFLTKYNICNCAINFSIILTSK